MLCIECCSELIGRVRELLLLGVAWRCDFQVCALFRDRRLSRKRGPERPCRDSIGRGPPCDGSD